MVDSWRTDNYIKWEAPTVQSMPDSLLPKEEGHSLRPWRETHCYCAHVAWSHYKPATSIPWPGIKSSNRKNHYHRSPTSWAGRQTGRAELDQAGARQVGGISSPTMRHIIITPHSKYNRQTWQKEEDLGATESPQRLRNSATHVGGCVTIYLNPRQGQQGYLESQQRKVRDPPACQQSSPLYGGAGGEQVKTASKH